MEDKRIGFKNDIQKDETHTPGLFDKAKNALVRTADQNDDGKFNKEDVSVIADSVGDIVKSEAKNESRRYLEYEIDF